MEFNPEMMILARESRGLTQTELSELVSVKQGTISKVEGGVLQPQPSLIAALAEKLNYTDEFFYQCDLVWGFNSAVFFHRKRQSMPDRILRRLHAQMNLARMRINRLFRSVSAESNFRFREMTTSEYQGGVVTVARMMRSTWMLPQGPIRNVMETIENAGGVILKYDFGTRQADAISEWSPKGFPFFLVNSNPEISGARMRLTLAHEMAHVIMHRDSDPQKSDIEKEANEFAAEFLMPRREIKSSLYGLTMAKLGDLKKLWKVSMQALIQRAYELKIITDAQRRYLFINVVRRGGGRLHEPHEEDVPLENPTMLTRLIDEHRYALGYSLGDIAKLLYFADEDEFRAEYVGETRLRLV